MEPANWVIFLIVIVGGIGLFMFFRRQDAYARRGHPSDKRAGPSPSDKYLPAWVILSMSIAVWILAYQVNSVVKDICASPGRCLTAASAPGASADPSANDEAKAKAAKAKADDDVKKAKAEAEAKVAEATATAAAAAAAAPSAPVAKGK